MNDKQQIKNMQTGEWVVDPEHTVPGSYIAYKCSVCGGGEHILKEGHPFKELKCPACGSINIYPPEEIIPEENENEN